MSWSRIKTLLILLLLAVNIYLVYAIASQYEVTARIPADEIEAAAGLLKKDGITIADDALSGRRLDLKVWRSAFLKDGGEDGRELVISRLFGSADYTRHMTGSGFDAAVEGKGTLSFSDSDPLYISYTADGCDYAGEADEAASDPGSDRQVSWMRRANLANQFDQFLAGGESSSLTGDEKRAETEVDLAIYDRNDRRYIAHFVQKLDGCEIDGCGGYFSVKGDTVDYIRGSVVLMSDPVGYKAELLDEINVLFLERDSLSVGIGDISGGSEVVSGDAPSAPADDISRTVRSSSPVYCVIWSSDKSEFYLIPSWKLVYDYEGGESGESIRNAVNGSVYLR